MSATTAKVFTCMANCTHEYQDKKYGKGKRVMNPIKVGSGGTDYRCTVCGKINAERMEKKETKLPPGVTVKAKEKK